MATVAGFVRWLKSLRALNAQRQAVERHAAEIRALAARADEQSHGLNALVAQLAQQQQALEQREREIAALETQLAQRNRDIEDLHTHGDALREALERQVREFSVQLDALRAHLQQESDQASKVRDGVRLEITGLTSRLDGCAEAASALDHTARELERRTASLHARLTALSPPFPSVSGLAGRDSAAWFHSAVEATFRGPVEDIRGRFSVYTPYVAAIPAAIRSLPALDLGCGRGEWLGLLHDAHFAAIGIDDNPVSVERCVAAGLRAIRGDAIEYLQGQPDASACVVSAFHLVEHLPTESLVAMLLEARRVLAPGGLLLLETPNPDNVVVGSNSFYLDPTHRHPIPSPLLRLIVEFAKFEVVETLALQPDDAMRQIAESERWPATLARLVTGPRDTGVIAMRPIDATSGQ